MGADIHLLLAQSRFVPDRQRRRRLGDFGFPSDRAGSVPKALPALLQACAAEVWLRSVGLYQLGPYVEPVCPSTTTEVGL